ncbi:hypothetical protein GTY67_13355 [Streptomyces sp. SID8374]|uniref:hypothetical protein n=1 Tax=Streptomyces sp. SID8374 TaxID=2690354 RepID=UPI001370DC8E|nr:hypothetical protein [Streptomyces sp. SID8374]MYX14384.1 hypothetical protein [Streptomyces sp. SID8374]
MSKPNRKVIRLQEMRAQIAQKAGVKHVDLVFEVPGDTEAEVRERTCSFLTQDHWPLVVVKAVEADSDSTNLSILRKIATPPEAFDQLVEVAQLTVGELTELLKEINGEAGTDTGEGSGSSSSSKSTPEPSEPTSSGTTQAAA